MVTQFDEKGKIYTPVITKEPVSVIIQTTQHQIRGDIHLRLQTRMIDELEKSSRFLAITNVSILNPDGEVIFKTKFMTINLAHIIWILPIDEMIDKENKK